ncbi:hypothetical protein D3242_25315 [Mesorhizobium jarvisii]|uniref:Uncharacterized protein n=1 Tax=Mesorhizobium jarvisii TaxID=1777867 RepID=A0AA92XCG9_9HYPH|nr:hypothetical protein A9174_22655 [Mesorhizobium loti NZP2037]RJT30682.1 hypothetical protein D3242_25315 [Mesorhizobium jarvisii]
MRLQKILQGRLGGVVGAGVAGTVLGRIQGLVRSHAGRLVLLVTKSPDRIEDIQEIGRHRAGRQADQVV